MKMEKEDGLSFLEWVVGPLEEISSWEELGRLLLERMKTALLDGEGHLHFPPPRQDEGE